MRDRVVSELLERIVGAEPALLEALTVELLERVGYGEGRVTGGSGDRGIDGIMEVDALWLDRIYVQCKRFATPIGGPMIRAFLGALHQHNASRGVFVTTSDFTEEAKSAAGSAHGFSVALVSGRRFAELLYDRGIAVVPDQVIEIKRIDEGRFSPKSIDGSL